MNVELDTKLKLIDRYVSEQAADISDKTKRKQISPATGYDQRTSLLSPSTV